jgi:hypothetical protein
MVCLLSVLNKWAAKLTNVGAQKERAEMAEGILERRDNINVIVTTYDLAAKKEDNRFLRRLKPDVSSFPPNGDAKLFTNVQQVCV